MKLKSIIGIPLALATVFFSFTIMTVWWQILFSRTLENYLPAKLYEIEKQQRNALALEGISALENSLWVEPTTVCSRPVCIETKQKKYHIRQTVLDRLEAERQNQKRIFYSESLFLISVMLLAAVYMLALVRREKRRSDEREQFLAMATHELKHPISALSLLLESLKRGSLPPDQQERFIERGLAELRSLKQQSENLLRVQQLKVLSRPEKSPYLLVPVLRDLILRCEQQRGQSGRCQLTVTDETLTTRVNRQGLNLIIGNLLDNALIYSTDTVTVSVTTSGRFIRVDISDLGLGFTKEEKNNFGKMFFRSTRHQIQNIRGSGLGLFTVMRLVSLMKLKFTMQSNGPEKGSCFSVFLKK